jgi:hypothetical protein
MNTSYLYITPKTNWDSQQRRAIDQNLVTKKTFPWNTPVRVVKPGELSNPATINVQDFDKDIYDMLINSVDYKVINIISKPEPDGKPGHSLTLTEDVVKEMAEELMEANGSTTNLDVKEALRAKGYWATQHAISDHMQSILRQNSGTWDSSNNGTFNTYTFQNNSAVPQSSVTTTPSTHVAATKKPRKPSVRGKVVPLVFSADLSSSNDPSAEGKQMIKDAVNNKQLNSTNFFDTKDLWVVYCPKTKQVALYEPDFSSDDVRNAFRKTISVTVQETRARRFRNIENWTF